MKLRATRRELTRAYRLHKPFCTDLSVAARKLIALYCIECGLKALILRERLVESTDQLPTDAEIGHDLMVGLKLLKAPVTLFGMSKLQIKTCHQREPQETVHPKDLHQTLRYGIPVSLQAETATEITNIMTWLEGKLNEGN